MSFYLHDTYTLLLISYFIFCSWIMFTDKLRLPLLMEYAINQKYTLRYHRPDSLLFKVFSYINTTNIISILISFYLFSVNQMMTLFLFFKIFIVLTLFFFIKNITLQYLGYIFEDQTIVKKYYYGSCSLYFCVSLIFFPIILILSYTLNGILLEKLSLSIFFLFIGIFVVFKIIVLKRSNLFTIKLLFYNILYLYSLELLPYLFLFKIIGDF